MPSGSKKRKNEKKKKMNEKDSPLPAVHGNINVDDTHQHNNDNVISLEVVAEAKQTLPFPIDSLIDPSSASLIDSSSSKEVEDTISIDMVKSNVEVVKVLMNEMAEKDVEVKSVETAIISEVEVVKVEELSQELSLLPNSIPSVEVSSGSELNGVGEVIALSEPFNQSDHLARKKLENFRQMLQKTMFDVEKLLEEFNSN